MFLYFLLLINFLSLFLSPLRERKPSFERVSCSQGWSQTSFIVRSGFDLWTLLSISHKWWIVFRQGLLYTAASDGLGLIECWGYIYHGLLLTSLLFFEMLSTLFVAESLTLPSFLPALTSRVLRLQACPNHTQFAWC